MWWVRHHNKGVGTSPSHPRPKRIFSTDLNRNRVITEKKIKMYYVRHHIKGGLVRHHNENRLGVHKAEANFPIKRKWSLSKKMWCVCESWNKGVGTSPLMTGVIDLYQEVGFKCWKTRVWKYVTYRKESRASECTSPLFLKLNHSFQVTLKFWIRGYCSCELVALGCGVLFAANDECARLSRWLHMHVQMTLGLRFVQSSILR